VAGGNTNELYSTDRWGVACLAAGNTNELFSRSMLQAKHKRWGAAVVLGVVGGGNTNELFTPPASPSNTGGAAAPQTDCRNNEGRKREQE